MNDKVAGKKMLIVEDEELLSEMYQEIFEREGFFVQVATSGEEALQKARQLKPDFILLDILLPAENGIYFLKHRKEYPELLDTPVMVFSNLDDPRIKKDALHLGAKDYLIKTNYTPQEVVEKVRAYMV